MWRVCVCVCLFVVWTLRGHQTCEPFLIHPSSTSLCRLIRLKIRSTFYGIHYFYIVVVVIYYYYCYYCRPMIFHLLKSNEKKTCVCVCSFFLLWALERFRSEMACTRMYEICIFFSSHFRSSVFWSVHTLANERVEGSPVLVRNARVFQIWWTSEFGGEKRKPSTWNTYMHV